MFLFLLLDKGTCMKNKRLVKTSSVPLMPFSFSLLKSSEQQRCVEKPEGVHRQTALPQFYMMNRLVCL